MKNKFFVISGILMVVALTLIFFLRTPIALSLEQDVDSISSNGEFMSTAIGSQEETSKNSLGDIELPHNSNGPAIQLIEPVDGFVDIDGDVNFTFRVSHNKLIRSCILYHNINMGFGPDKKQINTFAQLDYPLEFTLTNIPDGSYNWNVVCEDEDYNENAPISFSFTVSKNPPLSSQIPDISINEDGIFEINLSGYFSDPKGDKLTYGVAEKPNDLKVIIDDKSGMATIEPEKNWFGEDSLSFNALDQHGLEVTSNLVKISVMEEGDTFPRFISLSAKGILDGGVDADGHLDLECNVTDDYGIKEVSLYSDTGGEWELEEVKEVNSLAKSLNFILDDVSPGVYGWGCLAEDNSSQETLSDKQKITVEPEIKIINGILTEIVNNVDYPAFMGVEYSKYLDNSLKVNKIIVKDRDKIYFTIDLSQELKVKRGDIIKIQKLITVKNNEIFNKGLSVGRVKDLIVDVEYNYKGNDYIKKQNQEIKIRPGGWIF